MALPEIEQAWQLRCGNAKACLAIRPAMRLAWRTFSPNQRLQLAKQKTGLRAGAFLTLVVLLRQSFWGARQ